jgi:hypothetical protein
VKMDHGGVASQFNESHDGPPEAETESINLCKEQLKDDWHVSCFLAQNRHEKLTDTHEIERFDCDADEITAWIIEKDVVISSDIFGRCSNSVQTFHVRAPLAIKLPNIS